MSEVDIFIEKLHSYRKGVGTLIDVEEVFVKLDRFNHFHKFINDGDIRATDIDFSIMQEKALSKFLKLLKAKDYEEAEQITFLSED